MKFCFPFALKEKTAAINKSEFIVSDDDMGNDDAFDEEAEGLFDVCAFCDNGGDVLLYASTSLVF